MKQTALLLMWACLAIAGLNGCKKEENTGTCSSGNNFCVTIGSEQISGTATLQIIGGPTPRYRVAWEEGSGSSYRNIELDIFGSSVTPGNYSLNGSQANLQYYIQSGNQNFQATSGTVNITSVSTGSISGTFTGEVNFNGDVRQVTDGNFVNVTP